MDNYRLTTVIHLSYCSVVVETTDDSKTNRVGFVMRVIDGKTWDESLADPNSWEFTNFQQYIEPGVK